MIFQEVRTKDYIERFTIGKFQMAKDISILCNNDMVFKLIDSVKDENFSETNIDLDDSIKEYIVSKVSNILVVEPAKNSQGNYKFIDANYIIVTNADKLSATDLDNFVEQRQMWLFADRQVGALFNGIRYLEFGGRVLD